MREVLAWIGIGGVALAATVAVLMIFHKDHW